MIRRDFLKKALAVPALAASAKLGYKDSTGVSEVGLVTKDDTLRKKPLSPHTHFQDNLAPEAIKPKALSDGSKVAFTAPASAASKNMINRGIATFETFGCEVVIGQTILKQDRSYKYFSASEEMRAQEFMRFVTDPSIDAIICGRGGYGVMRILDHLDWKLIAENPKIIMGFSDITALVNPAFSVSNIVAFHGPVGYSSFNKFTTDYVRSLLFRNSWDELIVNFDKGINFGSENTATGKLVGGNLKLIVSLLGTPYSPDFKDKILFLEDVSEQPYKIDRMLTQLKLAGVFEEISAILIGNIGSLDAKHHFKPYGSFTIRQVFQQILSTLEIPVMANLPFGHTKNNLTMPIGIKAEIDPKSKQLRFLERPVT